MFTIVTCVAIACWVPEAQIGQSVALSGFLDCSNSDWFGNIWIQILGFAKDDVFVFLAKRDLGTMCHFFWAYLTCTVASCGWRSIYFSISPQSCRCLRNESLIDPQSIEEGPICWASPIIVASVLTKGEEKGRLWLQPGICKDQKEFFCERMLTRLVRQRFLVKIVWTIWGPTQRAFCEFVFTGSRIL